MFRLLLITQLSLKVEKPSESKTASTVRKPSFT